VGRLAGCAASLRNVAARLRYGVPYGERCRAILAAEAPGRTVIDVGCMWQVDGAYAFHAAEHGATRVVGVDLMPATAEFVRRNDASERTVEFIQADVNDPDLATRAGRFDVVFCSGVIYHVPDPVSTLARLRSLCSDTLVLGSATIRERGRPQTAIFLPFMAPERRRRLVYRTTHGKVGLDTAFAAHESYANWYWLFTASCLEAMLAVAGFRVVSRYGYRRASCIVARAC
jgi:2-polyprenyl-3-methyl-5-hydroxy-6-metoxy-1,4-benzoquinol methylase